MLSCFRSVYYCSENESQGSYVVVKFQDLLEKSWNLKIVKNSPGILSHFEKGY